MKSESGPLKYRLARKEFFNGTFYDEKIFLQGWFEWTEYAEAKVHGASCGVANHGGEWRTLDTVDLED